jgi:hypothetical protein
MKNRLHLKRDIQNVAVLSAYSLKRCYEGTVSFYCLQILRQFGRELCQAEESGQTKKIEIRPSKTGPVCNLG